MELGSECAELFTLGWKSLRKMLWGWVEVGDKTGLCFKKSSALSSGEKEADQRQGAPQETQGVPVFIPVPGEQQGPRGGEEPALSLKTGSCGNKPSPRVSRNLRPWCPGPRAHLRPSAEGEAVAGEAWGW